MLSVETRVGFARRAGAALLDVLLITLLSTIVAPIVGGLLGMAVIGTLWGPSRDATALGGVVGAAAGVMIGVIVASVAYWVFEGSSGLTPGKLALGIRVGAETGAAADRRALFTRSALKYGGLLLSALGWLTRVPMARSLGHLAVLALVGGFFLALGADRQALHDRLARTAVFRRRPGLTLSRGGS